MSVNLVDYFECDFNLDIFVFHRLMCNCSFAAHHIGEYLIVFQIYGNAFVKIIKPRVINFNV